ncbi:carbonic anhydrase 4a [Rhinoraja longicauda]
MSSLILFLTCLLLSSLVGSDSWCYDSESVNCGPSNWHHHSPFCKGNSQSPVDIITEKALLDPALGPIVFKGYDDPDKSLDWTIENNGHTVQLNLNGPLTISGGKLPSTYKAVQLHFHWGTTTTPGAEHIINGVQYPMEMHIVHMNVNYRDLKEALKHADGLAVLGIMFVESSDSESNVFNLIQYLKEVPDVGNTFTMKAFSLEDMVPSDDKVKAYYRYDGSLTTPTCNEAVIWTIFREPFGLSKTQLNAFPKNLRFNQSHHMVSNFRPIQKLNGRKVYISSTGSSSGSSSGSNSFHLHLLMYGIGVWGFLLLN